MEGYGLGVACAAQFFIVKRNGRIVFGAEPTAKVGGEIANTIANLMIGKGPVTGEGGILVAG